MFNLILFSLLIFGLIFGKGAYALSRLYEGRKLSNPYYCSSCKNFLGIFFFVSPYFYNGLRCTICLKKIDPWLFITELSMGGLFTLTFYVFPFQWIALELILFIFMSLTACIVDIKRTILPDTLTLGGIGVVFIGSILNPEREWTVSLVGIIVGGLIVAAPSYIFYLMRKIEGMGGGDVKMLAWIGALLGAKSVIHVLFLSCVFATIFSIIFYIKQGVKKSKKPFMKTELAFGPYLVYATYLYVFCF